MDENYFKKRTIDEKGRFQIPTTFRSYYENLATIFPKKK
jgi:DNA-binding transcriptional regulator/RsmH inhibitor MraZ